MPENKKFPQKYMPVYPGLDPIVFKHIIQRNNHFSIYISLLANDAAQFIFQLLAYPDLKSEFLNFL